MQDYNQTSLAITAKNKAYFVYKKREETQQTLCASPVKVRRKTMQPSCIDLQWIGTLQTYNKVRCPQTLKELKQTNSCYEICITKYF